MLIDGLDFIVHQPKPWTGFQNQQLSELRSRDELESSCGSQIRIFQGPKSRSPAPHKPDPICCDYAITNHGMDLHFFLILFIPQEVSGNRRIRLLIWCNLVIRAIFIFLYLLSSLRGLACPCMTILLTLLFMMP